MATILASQLPLVEATSKVVTWQESLQRAIRSRSELLEILDLAGSALAFPGGGTGESDFPLLVPREYVRRMKSGRVDDPLLLQVLSTPLELLRDDLASLDPVGDAQSEVLPGLLKKYASRALLIASGKCAVHCRYCFRRNYAYETAPKSPKGWQAALDFLSSDLTIDELILSGGDPLMVSDTSLQWLIDRVEEIAHIRRLRIHTRFPVVIPQRVTSQLIEMLRRTRLQAFVVLHINHEQELDTELCEALAKLKSIGVTLLNQAVLLRGVNDTLIAQEALCRRLVDAGIIPYYLHQLDRVQGAMHFESDIATGRELIASLRAHLPGYAIPKFVMEVAGEDSKRPL